MHLVIEASLDYQPPCCPHYEGNMIKYDFQKASKIPILDIQGWPTLVLLKNRRFQCKSCKRVTVSQTSWPITMSSINFSSIISNRRMSTISWLSLTKIKALSILPFQLYFRPLEKTDFTFKMPWNYRTPTLNWELQTSSSRASSPKPLDLETSSTSKRKYSSL